MSEEEQNILLYGSRTKDGERIDKKLEGIYNQFKRLVLMKGVEEQTDNTLKKISRFLYECKCPDCRGKRLNKTTLSCTINGLNMAEAYTYLYSVENSLRLFIEKVAKEKYGDSYFSQLTIPRNLQRTIAERQKNDDANKWLSVRGTELFYLDFKDLGAVIDNNWDIFKDYFPSQYFILSKLNDMAECRNKIAHNSYVDDIERNLMKTYYNVILRQISDSVDKS